MRRLLFPARCAAFADVWHVSGLSGTGSDSYSVKDLFAPQAHSYPCGPTGLPLAGPRCEPGPLYAFPLTAVYATGFSSLALGIARAALDAFVDLAAVKKPQWDTTLLRDDAAVQLQMARDEASLRSARAFSCTLACEMPGLRPQQAKFRWSNGSSCASQRPAPSMPPRR